METKSVICAIFLCLSVALSGTSCGYWPRKPARPAETPANVGEQAAPLVQTSRKIVEGAPALQPRILLSLENDSTFPSEQELGHYETVTSPNSVAFKRSIVTAARKDRELFIVWKADVFEANPIVNAYYVAERRDAWGEKFGDPERKNVSQDQAAGRWFIPIREILGEPYENANPADAYWVTVELHLADGQVVFVDIGFRVTAPLPTIKVVEGVARPVTSRLQTVASDVKNQGWEYAVESLTNPSHRELNLWIRKKAGEGWLHTGIASTSYSPGPIVDIPGGKKFIINEAPLRWLSRVRLELDQVQIQRSDREESFGLQGSQWQKFALRPHETVQLRWVAHLSGKQPSCALPSAVERAFPWSFNMPVCLPLPEPVGGCGSMPVTAEERRIQTWWLQGVKLIGNWQRESLVTEAGEAPKRGNVSVPILNNSQMFIADEDVNSSWPAFECQGLF